MKFSSAGTCVALAVAATNASAAEESQLCSLGRPCRSPREDERSSHWARHTNQGTLKSAAATAAATNAADNALL